MNRFWTVIFLVIAILIVGVVWFVQWQAALTMSNGSFENTLFYFMLLNTRH